MMIDDEVFFTIGRAMGRKKVVFSRLAADRLISLTPAYSAPDFLHTLRHFHQALRH